eukprot:2656074-Pyramimonas_sp.AAC.1
MGAAAPSPLVAEARPDQPPPPHPWPWPPQLELANNRDSMRQPGWASVQWHRCRPRRGRAPRRPLCWTPWAPA